MKILVSWLREYVDVRVSIDELARDLTMRGFEVASVEPVPGRPDDAVIDVEITANRPDCSSVVGMAREVSVAYGLPLRAPALGRAGSPSRPTPGIGSQAGRARSPSGPSRQQVLTVRIEDPALCPRYAAAIVDVQVGPSPAWMAERLTLSGVRSINNIVDVTNYVLLELGHPLHGFDHARLAGAEIVVRTARPGEHVRTLDGQDRALRPDMLVIADAERAQALAGIMGGAESEVGPDTQVVALESAYFEPAQVRRTRRVLGLSTEASYRFERGADPDAPVSALRRACDLLVQIGAGQARPGLIDVEPRPLAARTVALRWTRIGRVLGMEVSPDDVVRWLAALGFTLTPFSEGQARGPAPTPDGRARGPAPTPDGAAARSSHIAQIPRASIEWTVSVPGWRGDVTREEDLIEEVARCAGYDRLPVTFPPLLAPPARTSPRLVRDARVRELLVGAGFAECVTFTFIERAAATPFDAAPIAIANPLSELFAVLRPSVLPGLIDSLSHNRRREQHDLRLFELGTRFTSAHGETRSVAIGWTGAAAPQHWSGSGRPVDVFDVIGVGERIGHSLQASLDIEAGDHPALVPGTSARWVRVDESGRRVPAGWMGQLASSVADARGLTVADPVFVAEIDLDLAAPDYDPDRQIVSRPLPRHPSVVRDLSIVIPADLPAATVRGTIQAAAPSTLVSVREFDRYQGSSLPPGHVSLSLRLTFRDAGRTLTDAEVQHATDAIVTRLVLRHGAVLR